MSDNSIAYDPASRPPRDPAIYALWGIAALVTLAVVVLAVQTDLVLGLAALLLAPAVIMSVVLSLRHRASVSLRAEAEFFRRICANTAGATVLTTRGGSVISLNGHAEQRWGLRPDLSDLLANADGDPAALAYRLINRAARDGRASWTAEMDNPECEVRVLAAGPDRFVWLFDNGNLSETHAPIGSVPHFRRARGGEVTWMNTEAAHLLARLEDGAARPEAIRSDGILRFGGETSSQYRVCVLAGQDGREDVFLFVCDPDETSGWLDDGFLNDLPVAMARLRPDGTLDHANRAAVALVGDRLQPGVQLGSVIEGMGRSIAERLSETMRGREQGRSEVARGRIDDREMFLQVAMSRVIHNGAAFVLVVFSDATELKTLEAQFVQSQKMQAVGQLAGGVAHDFNNLLTAINGHCDLMLLRHDSSDTDYADLMQIRQNANRAAALVRQLLAFSRKQTLRPKTLHLYDTLSELTHLLNRLLGEKVKLTIDHDPDLFPVRVDERQLEQVVMNLVVNARDAMPDGGVVHLKTRRAVLSEDLERDRATVPSGRYVVIEVTDTGVGIAKDKIAKIFEPFYTTKKVGEGTGLGLSTAYGIIKQTGGFIFADSEPGIGTTFLVYLPAFDGERAQFTETAPIDGEAHTPVADLSGRGVVLLVEDEAPVRSFGARALQMRGYTVLEAESGEQALDVLSDSDLHVDLFVSDVVMPGLDGPSWVRKAREARPDVPTIFVSGYAEDAFKDGKAKIPNTSFLAKPFTLNELTENVKARLTEIG